MSEALIGIVGILLGLFISEYFRKQSRVEGYSKEIFKQRLGIYEKLFSKMIGAQLMEGDVIESASLSDKQKEKKWLEITTDLASFIDENGMYLNESISIHCMTTIVFAYDIIAISDLDKKAEMIRHFHANIIQAKKMIKSEAGLEKIEKHFGVLTNAKHTSDYIKRYSPSTKKK